MEKLDLFYYPGIRATEYDIIRAIHECKLLGLLKIDPDTKNLVWKEKADVEDADR